MKAYSRKFLISANTQRKGDEKMRLSVRDVYAMPKIRDVPNWNSSVYVNPDPSEGNFDQSKFLYDVGNRSLYITPRDLTKPDQEEQERNKNFYWGPHHSEIANLMWRDERSFPENYDIPIGADGTIGGTISGPNKKVLYYPEDKQMMNEYHLQDLLDLIEKAGIPVQDYYHEDTGNERKLSEYYNNEDQDEGSFSPADSNEIARRVKR
jgi:hypothetical protein